MPSSRKTRAAVLQETGATSLQEVTLPELQPGDVLLRMLACGVCSGEAMEWYVAQKTNKVLGHEVVGEVIEIASPCSFKVGDRLFAHHHVPCGECRFCRLGKETNCSQWNQSALIPGGYAEEFIVPACHLKKDTLKIPETISSEVATLIEPLGCCFRALSKARCCPDDQVLILGLGIMGMLNLLLFADHTMAPVLTTDLKKKRRDLSTTLGARASFDPNEVNPETDTQEWWPKRLADVVVVCPSSTKAIQDAFRWLAPGGRLILFAPPPPEEACTLPLSTMYFKEIEIHSSYSAGTEDCSRALQWIENNETILRSLISHILPLEKAGEALSWIREQRCDVGKIIVKPEREFHPQK